MSFRIISGLLLVTTVFILNSCSPQHSKIVVAKVGGDDITLGEFEKIYSKNVGGEEIAAKDSLPKYKSFLDLYVNFKMKLRDAKVRGFENDPALTNELNDYKEKIGTSYLIEKEIVTPGIKKLYDQRKYELRVSHIMITPDTMSDQDAKALASSIIEKINNGESYDSLAKKYSADKYSKDNGGDIYYITAGLIIPEFEDAAYATELGKIYPEPVKTRFGYHIIKVTDKRERIPQIRASHILIDFKKDSVTVDSAAALAQIKDIKKQLDNGANFAELAAKYSEDTGSKVNGGDLGFFERRMMVKEFDQAVFNLKKSEISDIVKTNFGYHLIQVTDMKPYPTFEEDRENLKKLFKKTRYDIIYAGFISKLKEEYNFHFNNNTVSNIVKNSDSAKVGMDYWNALWRGAIKDSTVYFYAGKSVTADTLFSKIEKNPEFNGKMIDEKLLNNAINKESENSVLTAKALELEKTDPEFASLMDDYKNGIFIFKLQEDEIWNKIQLDSTKLAAFYDMNKDKYKWPDRVSFSEIYSRKDSLINHYYDLLSSGKEFDTLAFKFTERPGLKEKAGKYDLLDLNNPLAAEANKLASTGTYTKPFKNGNGYSILKLREKDPARLKTFEEARAEVSGQFQESESKRLESEYIEKLKNLYHPELYYDKLEEAFKNK